MKAESKSHHGTKVSQLAQQTYEWRKFDHHWMLHTYEVVEVEVKLRK